MFRVHNEAKDDKLLKHEFVEFYKAAARNNNSFFIFSNFKNINIQSDLRITSDTSERMEILPRRSLSDNDEFIELLFKVVEKDDSEVKKEAEDLLDYLCTNRSLENEIRDQDGTKNWMEFLLNQSPQR